MTATATETERVVRRFVPTITDLRPLIARGDLLGSFCDTETTGVNTDTDQIVELSIVQFTFTANGHITGVGEARTWLEDPGMPIPPEATKVHGITDEMVHRKRIIDGEVNDTVADSAIVIAHVADFDRKMLEKRLPVFRALRWGCTAVDIPWADEGFEVESLMNPIQLAIAMGDSSTPRKRQLYDYIVKAIAILEKMKAVLARDLFGTPKGPVA